MDATKIVEVLIGIGGVLLFVILVFVIAFKVLKSSWAYKNALEIVQKNTLVIGTIGQPIRQKGVVAGSVNINGSSGTANITIPISGATGKGKLYVHATKKNEKWEMASLVFKDVISSEEIQLVN